MLIVLEGVDGVGKTTLANNLALLLDGEVIHSTRETPNDQAWFMDMIKRGAKGETIIADRFFWGQFVYQEEKDRKLSIEELHAMEMLLHLSGGKLVYVTADVGNIRERLKARGETTDTPVEDLIERFNKRMRMADCPVTVYNTDPGCMEE